MKFRINICQIYLFIILLIMLNGTLYAAEGIVALGLQLVFILFSLYYTFYANSRYHLNAYFKALNVLLIMFTIYGLVRFVSSEQLMVKGMNYLIIDKYYSLKITYISLLPVYPFYVFAKQGLLKENTIKFWFFIFLIVTIQSFYYSQGQKLQNAIGNAEEFTNNLGYTFLSLIPLLVVFYKKPIIQYLGIAVLGYYIVICMKRGSIVIFVLCLIWFLYNNLKKVQKKRKWITVVLSIVVVASGFYLYYYMMATSDYFQYRLMQTEEGDSSGRDRIYSTFYEILKNEGNPFRFLFGYGTDGTLKTAGFFAHNDWIEIAIDYGFLGVVIYLFYWFYFYILWRKTRIHPQAFMAIGMVFLIYFIATFFSMSYSCVSRWAMMVLGYYIAVYETPSLAMGELPQNSQSNNSKIVV